MTLCRRLTRALWQYGDMVGFDPSRKHHRSNFDYFFVAGAVIVCILLVLWAFLG